MENNFRKKEFFMSINITRSISLDTCQGMIQRGDCNNFVSALVSEIGTDLLKISNLDTTIPLSNLQQIELAGRVMLETLVLLKGKITASSKWFIYARSMHFQDLRNVPLENISEMRDFLRTKFIEATEGMKPDAELQRINQTLWHPVESLSVAQQQADSIKLEKERGAIDKLNELCFSFHEGIGSRASEDLESCSVYLEGYIADPTNQAKDDL
jgi:hypothetical protein